MAYECSFCGIDARSTPRMIAGPHVFICADCVGLCAEILVEEKAASPECKIKLLGSVQALAELRTQLEESTREQRRMRTFLRLALKNISEAIGEQPGSRCMWCGRENLDDDDARQHAAMCEEHPAVKRLRALDGYDGRGEG